jgi:hypothetical protein
LYEKLGVILFALQIKDKVYPGPSKLFLNPANFVIPSQRDFIIEAFVVAKNKADSDLSFDNGRDMTQSTALEMMNKGVSSIATIVKSAVSEQNERAVPSKAAKPDNSDSDRPKPIKKSESKWKLLKRSTLLQKKVQASSLQEMLQQKEDAHFAESYYLRSKPADIQEVTIKTSVIEEFPFINNHLLIIGKGLSNLYDLIRPLRARYQGPLRYIVILSPSDIPFDVWQRISMFDAILYVRGSALEESSLRRAGIFRAQKVVVLAASVDRDSSSISSEDHVGLDALVDSDAIFSYQCVRRMNPEAELVVEIVNHSSIAYLVTDGSKKVDHRFSPQYAAGMLFTTALLDSLVCQVVATLHVFHAF